MNACVYRQRRPLDELLVAAGIVTDVWSDTTVDTFFSPPPSVGWGKREPRSGMARLTMASKVTASGKTLATGITCEGLWTGIRRSRTLLFCISGLAVRILHQRVRRVAVWQRGKGLLHLRRRWVAHAFREAADRLALLGGSRRVSRRVFRRVRGSAPLRGRVRRRSSIDMRGALQLLLQLLLRGSCRRRRRPFAI